MKHVHFLPRVCAFAVVVGGFMTSSAVVGSAPRSAPPTSDAPTQLTVGGSGLGLVPPGEPDTVTLAAVGAFRSSDAPYVVRNNTDSAVSDVVVTGVARSASGELLGMIETLPNHATKPTTLQPGDVAIGMAFADIDLPPDAVFEYTVTFAEGANSTNVDLIISESSWQTDHLIGIAHNPTDKQLGTGYMGVLCMEADGTPTTYEPFNLEGPIGPQADAIFQAAGLYSVDDCSTYLVAGYSY
jgi:hypothetical protein